MGYAAGLIGLTAPMAALAAYLRFRGRAERERRKALLASAPASAPTPARLDEGDRFDAWQSGFSGQVQTEQDLFADEKRT